MYTPIYVTQVYSGSKEDTGDGQWIPVQPVPGALTINTGDMMQVSSVLMGYYSYIPLVSVQRNGFLT